MESKVKSLLLFQSGSPMVLTTVSFASGIGISLHCNQYSFNALSVGILCLVIASCIAYRKARIRLSFALVQIAILSCGILISLAHRDGYNRAHLSVLISSQAFPLNEPVLFEGRIDREDSSVDREIEVIVNLEKYRRKNVWSVASGKGILRIATADRRTHSRLKETLAPGARLRAWAVWKKPRNFENPGSMDRIGVLSRRGIFIVGRTKSARLIEFVSDRSSSLPNTVATFVRDRTGKMMGSMQPGDDRRPEAMLSSLLIGDRSGLDQITREIFQNTGSFHILVVSGLHVAWISGAWLLILKTLRISERVRYISTAVLILMYTWVVGFQPGITRCLWMFYLYLAGRWFFRRTGSVNILFSAALLLLVWNPDHLLEAGYQLSFLSVAAITMTAAPIIESVLKPLLEPMRHSGQQARFYLNPGLLYRWGRKLRIHCELCSEVIEEFSPRFRSNVSCFLFRCMAFTGFAIGSMILLSLSVQVWIAPLLGFYFNRISWIAPIANPLLVPIASLTLATGIMALFLTGLPYLGTGVSEFARISAAFLLDSAECISKIPGSWQRCPTPPVGAVSIALLFLILWSFFRWKRCWIPFACNSLLLLFLACGSFPILEKVTRPMRVSLLSFATAAGTGTADLSLTLLDVGEGDCLVVRFPDRRLWVLDAGGLRGTSFEVESSDVFDIGEAVVSRYLWAEWGAHPDCVILSHTDIDHAGGIAALLRNFRIRRLEYPKCIPDAFLAGLLETAHSCGTVAVPISKGWTEELGAVRLRTLHPPEFPVKPSTNDSSLVIQMSYKRFSVLLTGDLGIKGEAALLSYAGDLNSRMLKVAHHGSASGTSSAFLDAVNPEWAFLSSGRNNPFGHPSPFVLSRLRNHGTGVYQTAKEGALTFRTDGIRYEIHSYMNGILEKGELPQ